MKGSIICIIGLITLIGCSDNYPKSGQLTAEGTLIGLRDIGKHGVVYRMNEGRFEQWKSMVNDYTIENLSRDKMLSLRKKFVSSAYVRKSFEHEHLLAAEQFEFDAYVQQQYADIDKGRKNLEANIALEQDTLDELGIVLAKSKTAKAKLKAMVKNYQAQRAELKKIAKTKIELAKHSLSTLKLSASHIKTVKHYLSYSGLSNFKLDDNNLSCKQRLMKSYRERNRAEYYLYAEPITINNEIYCAYYKTSGQINKIKKQTLEAFTSTHRASVIAAAIARLKDIIIGNNLDKKASNIKQDNPALVKQSNLFTYQQRALHSKTERNIAKLNKKLMSIKDIDKQIIADRTEKEIHGLLSKAKPYYLLDALQNMLDQESKIQPDGNFTLKSGGDFYLIGLQHSNKLRPSTMMFGVLRMQNFKEKETAAISISQLFKFNQLPEISL